MAPKNGNGSAVERLLKRRQSLKSDLEFETEEVLELETDALLFLLKTSLESLEWTFEQFTENFVAVEERVPEYEDALLENHQLKAKFKRAKAHLLFLIDSKEKELGIPKGSPRQTAVDQNEVAQVKLPPVDIRPFDGLIENWLPFRDMFVALVHEKAAMKPVEKMHYLKSYVTEEAADFIKHIPITADNYAIAWQRLEDRYHNARVLVDAHIERLINQPPVQAKNAAALRKMINITNENLHMIESLGAPTENWDPLVVHVLMSKLDTSSQHAWKERLKATKNLVKLTDFIEFLETRSSIIDEVRPASGGQSKETPKPKEQRLIQRSMHARTLTCYYCSEAHALYKCEKFLALSDGDRMKTVESKSLCVNCLFSGHTVDACRSKFKCKFCQQTHNGLLHNIMVSRAQTVAHVSTEEPSEFSGNLVEQSCVLLATARIPVYNEKGKKLLLKALLDQGSQVNIISESACQLLCLGKIKANIPLMGVGNSKAGTIKWTANVTIGSRIDPVFRNTFRALVMQDITKIRPNNIESLTKWPHLKGLELADDAFYMPEKVDLLLGASVYADIILQGLIKGPAGAPIAQQSAIGWILSGATTGCPENFPICHYIIPDTFTENDSQIANQLKKFWEIEELQKKRVLTAEEKLCVEHFRKTIHRDETGRYIASLPFKHEPASPNFLGNSRAIAEKRLIWQERRFDKNPTLKASVDATIQELLDMGHARVVPVEEENIQPSYIMPYHAVIKESSSTTKVRVVFDASCKTSNQYSLNDRLMVGPTVQQSLFKILIRWRTHRIVFTCDCEKMYRQFKIHPDHRRFQRILYRFSAGERIRMLELLTLVFGLSSSAYEAIQCLIQLIEDEGWAFPLAAMILEKDSYVDDVPSGADSLEIAIESAKQLIGLLGKAQIPLRKWTSNSAEFLETIPEEYREINNLYEIGKDDTIKALGIWWHPTTDDFRFKVNIGIERPPTKRVILSDVSKLFDPFGWLGPVIILAKIILQHIWVTGVKWDDFLPLDVQEKWLALRKEFVVLEELRVKRWLSTTRETSEKTYELHGFADASEWAFAGVVYIKTLLADGSSETHLIAAKTRVAPVKKVTLARLELCAAVLLSHLMDEVKEALELTFTQIVAWSDSMVTLAWIRGHPLRWKTFVANRVTEIQDILSADMWRYVPSQKNPADCATRGLMPTELINFRLWWDGPKFLSEPEDQWPKEKNHAEIKTMEELRGPIALNLQTIEDNNPLLHRFSSLERLVNITSYCLRIRYKGPGNKILTVAETQFALNLWIRYVQHMYFPDEIGTLLAKKPLNMKSKLIALSPILDNDLIMRVGGRLDNSDYPYEKKHPIILPSVGHFTTLIVREAHERTLHGGTQLTLGTTRQEYWIVHGRIAVQKYIRRCMKCARFAARPAQQLMANLPSMRIQRDKCFVHCGVDYCGPFDIKLSETRNAKTMPGYVSLFVCFNTRAIHLELVSSLSTQAFLAAFVRFGSRRAFPSDMYSDCGTNFVGADGELGRLFEQSTSAESEFVRKKLLKYRTQWHFNPPSAPHFGGLWESGVKSVKHHLYRVLGETRLTFEAMATVLAQIESCLNSRPICKLTADSEDIEALTPGHFLVGGPLNALPEPSYLDTAPNRLTKWQTLQQMYQSFWSRWYHEYLDTLQARSKWKEIEPNMREQELVLIKDDRLPASKWLMGRIISVHRDKHGLVRSAEVKTAYSTLIRPIAKLCRLPPVEEFDEEEQ